MTLRATHAGSVDLLSLHRRSPALYPFLLQSVAGHPQSGRYDILFAFPGETLEGGEGDFFAGLTAALARERAEAPEDLPYAGGWFLLLGYESARRIEPRLKLPASPFALPEALAVRCPAALIHDREAGQVHLVAEQDPEQIRRMQADLAGAGRVAPRGGALVRSVTEEPPQRFLKGVERIHDYLAAGDVFQVNLSRAWQAELAQGVTAADLYARLRVSNPAPFAGIAAYAGSAVLSSSPERLVEVRGREVQTRPIAGTQPRSDARELDEQLRAQLIASVKERAEHIMLIDLERSDLGRVCETGSVEVSELMTVESYAHVHHIVSNVRGRLRPGAGPGEVLRAVFPGGTITGCPKVRAMEIIAELEAVGRGPYTGAMGYLGVDGRMDLNILIRSLVVEGSRVSFRTGAGIVADSDAGLELAETRAKARGLLEALGAAAQ